MKLSMGDTNFFMAQSFRQPSRNQSILRIFLCPGSFSETSVLNVDDLDRS